jgi:hypothetical protein
VIILKMMSENKTRNEWSDQVLPPICRKLKSLSTTSPNSSQKNGKTSPTNLGKEASSVQKLNAENDGSIFSTLRLARASGSNQNFNFFTLLTKKLEPDGA